MKIKAKDIKEGMTIERNSEDVRWDDLAGIMRVDCITYLGTGKKGEDEIFNDTFAFLELGTSETFVVKSDTLVEIV